MCPIAGENYDWLGLSETWKCQSLSSCCYKGKFQDNIWQCKFLLIPLTWEPTQFPWNMQSQMHGRWKFRFIQESKWRTNWTNSGAAGFRETKLYQNKDPKLSHQDNRTHWEKWQVRCDGAGDNPQRKSI